MILVFFALAVMFATSGVAIAHNDPGAPTSTGITASITLFLADGTTPALPAAPLTECESIFIQATLSWAGGSNAAFEGGTWTITIPDGSGGTTAVDVTPVAGVPCIGDPANSTDDPNLPGGRGLCAGTPGTISSVLVPYTVSPADIDVNGKVNFRTDLTGAFAHIGTNDTSGVNAGTPIPIDVELCSDGDFCNGLETCDPALVFGPLDSRLGQCVPGEAPCVDDLFCADVTCNEETDQCDTTDTSSTVCPDDLFCSDVTCNEATDACDTTDHSATTCPDTQCTVCDEETNACEDNGECNNVATCRTPGFWGTHAGITQEVITECGECLNICGESVTNTVVQSPNSALEAICVSVAGDIRLQLARQLTAASLNCCVSGSGSNCVGLPIWEEVFGTCNAACAGGTTELTQICIDALDCLNNGGNILLGVDPDTIGCQTGTCAIGGGACGENLPACPDASACVDLTNTCHTAVLGVCADGSICTTENTTDGICNTDLSVCKPGPADSSKDCNLATGDHGNKNANQCTILPKPNSNANCSKFNQGETCCTGVDATTCDVVD